METPGPNYPNRSDACAISSYWTCPASTKSSSIGIRNGALWRTGVGESDQGGNLTQLPKSLREISSLRELYLHGNDGLGLPSAVIGPSWNKVANKLEKPASPAEILEYYFRLQQGDQHTLNEAAS